MSLDIEAGSRQRLGRLQDVTIPDCAREARLGVMFLAAALASIASPSALGQGNIEVYGPGARARAMGNAMVALEDAASAHSNPALVAKAPGQLVFHASYSLDVPTLEFAGDADAEPSDPLSVAPLSPVSGLTLGFLIPVDLVVEDVVFVGATGYFPTQVLIRARAHDPQRPFFYRYDSGTEHYDISVAIGAALLEWLSIGAGARLAAGQKGTIGIDVDPVRGRLTNQSIDTFQYPTASPTAGILVGPFGVKHLVTGSLGIAYKEKTSFDVDLPAALAIDGAETNIAVDIAVFANFQPRTVAGGLSFDVVDDVVIDVEAHYAFWSEAPPPMVIASLDLSGAGLEALGLDEGLDAPVEGQNRAIDPGFVDTLSIRTGAEWKLFNDVLRIRGGYQYRPTPVPDQTSGTNIIDATAHIVTGGFGLNFVFPGVKRPMTIDAAYQAQILEPRTATKVSATDAVGNWTASGAVHMLAVGFTYEL